MAAAERAGCPQLMLSVGNFGSNGPTLCQQRLSSGVRVVVLSARQDPRSFIPEAKSTQKKRFLISVVTSLRFFYNLV